MIFNLREKSFRVPDESCKKDSLGMKDINPDWIQAIHVVKDAEAVVNYGECAKHGVIIVDFKEGAISQMPLALLRRFK